MENFKMTEINQDIVLLVPIIAETPLSEIIKEFNELNDIRKPNAVIIDMLVYVGNRDNRFQYCKVDNGYISLNRFTRYNPPKNVIDKAYDLFSTASLGDIKRIFSPAIRRIVLERKKQSQKCF